MMKIVVIGGSGRIGSMLVSRLRAHGQDVVAASPDTGVNTLTGEGLAEALKDATVVVDVSNAPSWEDSAVMDFFETSTRNLLAREEDAVIGHHVALSVVGSDRLTESGYFRAKIAQENLIKASPVPYTIVRATQFYEFVNGIADQATHAGAVRLPHVLIQPMAAEDVAAAVARAAQNAPVKGTLEVAGPETHYLDELVRAGLAAHHDPRPVIPDPHSRYYGIEVQERTLLPAAGAQLSQLRFKDWLAATGRRAA